MIQKLGLARGGIGSTIEILDKSDRVTRTINFDPTIAVSEFRAHNMPFRELESDETPYPCKYDDKGDYVHSTTQPHLQQRNLAITPDGKHIAISTSGLIIGRSGLGQRSYTVIEYYNLQTGERFPKSFAVLNPEGQNPSGIVYDDQGRLRILYDNSQYIVEAMDTFEQCHESNENMSDLKNSLDDQTKLAKFYFTPKPVVPSEEPYKTDAPHPKNPNLQARTSKWSSKDILLPAFLVVTLTSFLILSFKKKVERNKRKRAKRKKHSNQIKITNSMENT